MWEPRFRDVGPIIGSAGAAVLCTVLMQHLASRQFELGSEIVCWILLPILFAFSKRSNTSTISREPFHNSSRNKPASSASLWIFAIGVGVACCYKAEIGIIGLFPALTPLLRNVEKYIRYEMQTSKISDSSIFFSLANTLWGTALTASFAIFTLSDWDLLDFALSIILLTSLLVVYVALIPRPSKTTHFLPFLEVEEAIVPLSLRVMVVLVIALGIQTTVFGLPSFDLLPMFSFGLAKALSWYFMIATTQYATWCIAPTIATFSMLAARDPFILSSDLRALAQVIISAITLGQIIHMLPKQARARSILWTFILVSLVPYLANIFAIKSPQYSALSSDHSKDHPIEVLIQNAKTDFERLLQRQSKNYTAASDEYRRRYHADPPPGFEAWYEFASSNQSRIVDEFDSIFDTISPFLRLSGKEVIQIMTDVQNVPNVDLWLCSFSSNNGKTRCSHPNRDFDRNIGLLFDTLLGDLRGLLPDVNFLVNHLDEPRVLTPPQSLQRGSVDEGELKLTDLTRRPSWDEVTKYCASQNNAQKAQDHIVETLGIPFITNRSSAMDLCLQSEYSTMHGILMCPTSFRLIEGLVPILSTGSLSTMGDLLFPSPAYIESEFRYDETHDIEWEKKENKLYWAGSTTGGFASGDGWRSYHRQRFVSLTQNLKRQQHSYIREKDGVVGLEKSSFLNSRLFDVAFTRIFQCERKYCRDQRAYFNSKSWADKDRALRSRLVFDIDGNGISGRYYKLLASKSVPLKQTIFREWHDERLVPWVHYIPVSQGMEDVPELVSYLTSTEVGQRRAKEIAELGREWFGKAFRDVDFSIYTYRLLLELARVQDPKREANQTIVRHT